MKFKEIYNPKYTYEGFFESYFIRPFFHHYADFKSKESASSYYKSIICWIIVTLGLAGIMLGQVGIIGPESGVTASIVVAVIWLAASATPLAALIARTLNGKPESELKPRLLAIDILLAASSILFFLLGLMMMITTLNSGALNPNAGMTNEIDSTIIEEETVIEEPIFTYQDEVTTVDTTIVDTMSDMTEPDLIDAEESFDPTIEPADDQLPTDSI